MRESDIQIKMQVKLLLGNATIMKHSITQAPKENKKNGIIIGAAILNV